MGLELRALGPLEVRRDGSVVAIRSRLRQVMLAVLLVHRGAFVPTSTLAEQLWPARQPASVAKSLQIHVHRLRRLLGDASMVRYRPPGYSLAMPDGAVDVDRFEDMVQRGRAALAAGDEAAAAELLRAAGALYRGPAFHGLDDVDELAAEAHRLARLRMTALEDRIAAELVLGEHEVLVAELEALVVKHPLHERFRAQLMAALYRTGRQVDALAVFRAGREILRDELGVEPNAECRALEKAIRAHDSALDRPPGTARPASPPSLQLPRDADNVAARGVT